MSIQRNDIHPMRFAASRPYFAEYMSFIRRHSSGDETYLSADDMMNEVTRGVVRQLSDERRLSTLDVEDVKEIAQQENMMLSVIAKFAWYGRNTFVISKVLMELLSKTDLDGLRPNDLEFPFRSFHVAFQGGLEKAIPFTKPSRILGCYVNLYDDCFSLMVVGRPVENLPWYEFEPWGYVSLDLSDKTRSVSELLIDWRDRHNDGYLYPESFVEVLGLVINVLCFFKHGGSAGGLPSIYPDDAPADLVSTLRKGRPSKHGAARAELLKRGFSVLKFVDVSDEVKHKAGIGLGREIGAHWRRGHYRRRFDADRVEIGKTWIHPTLVRADKGRPEHGHVYTVNA